MVLGVFSFECTNSVFIIIDENNSFSFSFSGHWNSEDSDENINKLNKLLELKCENDVEIHVEIEKRGNQKQIGDNENLKLSDFDTRRDSIIKELKGV